MKKSFLFQKKRSSSDTFIEIGPRISSGYYNLVSVPDAVTWFYSYVIWQNIVGWCQQTFCFQKFIYNAQQCFAFIPQANFPTKNLNFHWRWRWWDQIQAIFLNIFYFQHKRVQNWMPTNITTPFCSCNFWMPLYDE